MILFIFSILLFAVPISILNLRRSEKDSLVTVIFNNEIVDGIFNQYMMSLGEFELLIELLTGYGENLETIIIMIIFVGATFFTQITMLNMLIAIMGDTFERVVENRNRILI